MAIPWLTVLTSVPWTEVIKNAPRVADGAKRLWQTVGRKESGPEPVVAEVAGAAPGSSPAELHARMSDQETRLAELHAQMLASSELIKQLAEQNAQLIGRIELNRVRTRRLAWLAGAAGLVALAALALAV